MMDRGDWLTVIVACIAALPGLIALWQGRKKNEAETGKVTAEKEKIEAETKSIYEQVADRWAEHVSELQAAVEKQTKEINALKAEREEDKAEIRGLRKDITQVRRENEDYRVQLAKRDAMIEDAMDWANRLRQQVSVHAPHIAPEQFIQRKRSETWQPRTVE